MSNFLFRLFIIGICFSLVACSKVIEYEPGSKVGSRSGGASADKESQPVPYPSWAAGVVGELYGETSASEQSERYHAAVAQNPRLRYTIIYFDFDSTLISQESRKLLLEHASYLARKNNVYIRLEGHTDKRGSSGYNLSLGEQRAMAVQDFLRTNDVQGIQMIAVSYGEERPAITGDDESAYTKNRRVELIYR